VSGRLTPFLRLFFDTDALLAGAASTTGAAHLLLRLAELGLVEAFTCDYVRTEAFRNADRKLPRARPFLEELFARILTCTSDVELPSTGMDEAVHPKDLPVWLAFRASGARFLITYNLPDYPDVESVTTPGRVISEIRLVIASVELG